MHLDRLSLMAQQGRGVLEWEACQALRVRLEGLEVVWTHNASSLRKAEICAGKTMDKRTRYDSVGQRQTVPLGHRLFAIK